jgi:hypothetical protein
MPIPIQLSKNSRFYRIRWAEIAQSVQRLATDCTVGGSNSVRGEIFHTRPGRLLGQPTLLYNGYRVIPGNMAARTWRCPPTTSSAEVKERVELYVNSTSGPSWSILGKNLFYRIRMPIIVYTVLISNNITFPFEITVWSHRIARLLASYVCKHNGQRFKTNEHRTKSTKCMTSLAIHRRRKHTKWYLFLDYLQCPF